MVHDTEDEIIELTQVVKDEDFEMVDIIDGADFPQADEGPGQAETISGPVDDISMDDISQEQIDAAIERVIEKKFAGTIETVLFEAMEKVIQKEVIDIRERLKKGLDDIGSP